MKLVAAGDKAGNFGILNATTGALVHHTAVSFQHNQNLAPSQAGNVACPNTNGGIEYNGGSYDPTTNTFFVPSINQCGAWKAYPKAVYIGGQFYLGGALVLGSGTTSVVFTGDLGGNFDAFDGQNGKLLWHGDTGASIVAPPATCMDGGTRYVVVASGGPGFLKVPELTQKIGPAVLTAFALKPDSVTH